MNFIFTTGVFLVVSCLIAFVVLNDPDSPVPDNWNPLRPFDALETPTPITAWKFQNFASSNASCQSELAKLTDFEPVDDFEKTDQCNIRDRVRMSTVAGVSINALDTSCPTALRLSLWIHYDVKTAGESNLARRLEAVEHIGSYNCRPVRGSTEKMSSHATAEAIDITGFTFADGSSLNLIDGWDATGPKSEFLKEIRDASCRWFGVTLGPDFNSLHRDHFHLQNNGWGTCQ